MIPEIDTSQRPFVLIWELTQACDLACKHCRADAQTNRHPAELTTEEGKRLLDTIRSFGSKQLLVLSGGDPLRRDDAIELIEYGLAQDLLVTLTPSGTHSLTPDVIERLAASGIRRLALSLDGATARSHDAFRGEPGSFETTIRAAEAARDAGLPIQINTTVCDETVADLPGILDRVEALDAALWSVFFLVPVGRGTVLDSITPDHAERIMEWLVDRTRALEIDIKTTEAPHFRRVMLQAGAASPSDTTTADSIGRRSGIGAGDGFAFISHVGEVFPSGFLPHSVGNVRKDSIVDIYREAPLLQQLRDTDELRGKCGACEFRHVCGGSRSRAWAETGDPLESDPLCPYVPEEYSGPLPGGPISNEGYP